MDSTVTAGSRRQYRDPTSPLPECVQALQQGRDDFVCRPTPVLQQTPTANRVELRSNRLADTQLAPQPDCQEEGKCVMENHLHLITLITDWPVLLVHPRWRRLRGLLLGRITQRQRPRCCHIALSGRTGRGIAGKFGNLYLRTMLTHLKHWCELD